MNTFRLIVLSPDGNWFDDEIVMLTLRSMAGALTVMAGHMPLVTVVADGTRAPCKLKFPDGTTRVFYLNGGILSVGETQTMLISGSLDRKEE